MFLDEALRGRAPFVNFEIPPGRHRLRLEATGYQSWQRELELRPGETRELDAVLVPAGRDTAPGVAPVLGPAAGTGKPEPRTEVRPLGQAPRPPQEAEARSGWPWIAVVAGIVLAAGLAGWRRRARRKRTTAAGSGSRWHLRLLGSRLGGYQLLDEIGRGGMATTFRARRASDRREVALKVPHPSGDPLYLERFLREGRLGETLHHPGIVRILEAGEEQGVPFLAMELLSGKTLRQELQEHSEGLPLARALAITRALAEALDYAHGKGVVHRDLTPENVMLLPDGAVKVMDFGVARIEGQPGLTSSQLFLGSPLYAAPEAAEPRRIDSRSDLYSLGILLFEMLEGRPPFVHESVFRVMELHREAPLPAAESLERPIPEPVWALLARLCAKRPEDRYPSAQALLVDLGKLAG